jgi:hypothetical protein
LFCFFVVLFCFFLPPFRSTDGFGAIGAGSGLDAEEAGMLRRAMGLGSAPGAELGATVSRRTLSADVTFGEGVLGLLLVHPARGRQLVCVSPAGEGALAHGAIVAAPPPHAQGSADAMGRHTIAGGAGGVGGGTGGIGTGAGAGAGAGGSSRRQRSATMTDTGNSGSSLGTAAALSSAAAASAAGSPGTPQMKSSRSRHSWAASQSSAAALDTDVLPIGTPGTVGAVPSPSRRQVQEQHEILEAERARHAQAAAVGVQHISPERRRYLLGWYRRRVGPILLRAGHEPRRGAPSAHYLETSACKFVALADCRSGHEIFALLDRSVPQYALVGLTEECLARLVSENVLAVAPGGGDDLDGDSDGSDHEG